jgi:hypothetical protein
MHERVKRLNSGGTSEPLGVFHEGTRPYSLPFPSEQRKRRERPSVFNGKEGRRFFCCKMAMKKNELPMASVFLFVSQKT